MHLVVFVGTNLHTSSKLLAGTVIVLSSANLHKDPMSIIKRMSFLKILKNGESRIYPSGTPWPKEPYVLK